MTFPTEVIWVQFVSATTLFAMALWYWRAARGDWLAMNQTWTGSAIYEQARGTMRLAWLRVADALLFLAFGVVMVRYPAAAHSVGIIGTGAILLLTWLQLVKVLLDQWTRVNVAAAILADEHRRVLRRKDDVHP